MEKDEEIHLQGYLDIPKSELIINEDDIEEILVNMKPTTAYTFFDSMSVGYSKKWESDYNKQKIAKKIELATKSLFFVCGELKTLSKYPIFDAIKTVFEKKDIEMTVICGDKIYGEDEGEYKGKNKFLEYLIENHSNNPKVELFFNNYPLPFQVYNGYIHSLMVDEKHVSLEPPHDYGSGGKHTEKTLYAFNCPEVCHDVKLEIQDYLTLNFITPLNSSEWTYIREHVIEHKKLIKIDINVSEEYMEELMEAESENKPIWSEEYYKSAIQTI